jgi:thiol-disulfide isomerase/thioredoxin
MKRLLFMGLLLAVAACQQHETKKATLPLNTYAKSTATVEGPPQTAATNASTEIGAPMPAYKAKMLDGSTFDVAKEKGNVVFLNLWATWCGPCRYEIPALQAMHDKYRSDGFKVVGISLDQIGSDPVKAFVAEKKMTYPIAIDADGNLAELFHTTVIPTSVLIDRQGRIVWKKFGAIIGEEKSLDSALEKALAEKRG